MASIFTGDDILRERELFRYFQPLVDGHEDVMAARQATFDGSADKALVTKAIESPDTTLTALAQLCACRLDASRAMIRYATSHPKLTMLMNGLASLGGKCNISSPKLPGLYSSATRASPRTWTTNYGSDAPRSIKREDYAR